MSKCVNCGNELKPNAKFCPKCGVEVQGEGILKCPSCGKILPPGTAFCPDCGVHTAVNESDKRKKISRLVERYSSQIRGDGAFSSYESLSDTRKRNLLKFHKDLELDQYVCMIDTSIMYSGKEGLLFTLTGFYEHTGPFAGANFFEFSKIDDMQILDDGELRIYFKGDDTPRFKDISSIYGTYSLRELLGKILEIDKMYNTSYLNSPKSGHVSGIFNNKNREIFQEGQRSGYVRCSHQYEIKLRRQADLFLQTTNSWKQNKSEYENLLAEYDKTEEELRQKIAETDSSEYKERLEKIEEIRQKLKNLSTGSAQTISNAEKITQESYRVADVAKNAETIIKNLDEEFELQTKLRGKDIAFLFFATALQCVRQYFLTDFKERLGDQEAAAKTPFEKELDPHDSNKRKEAGFEIRHHKLYNPTFDEIILHPVPFDKSNNKEIKERIGEKEFEKINPFINSGKLGHRASVLGHDPILGWIFGTANIATSTLTGWNMQSFHIMSKMGKGGGDFLKYRASTVKVLSCTLDKLLSQGLEGKKIVGVSVLKEGVHLASDVNSKNSLPFPIVLTVDPKLASSLADYGLDMANILTITKQAALASAINMLVAMIHRMTYNEDTDGKESLFEVRTHKVITYSNVIASTSNVIAVAVGSAIGAATNNPDLIRKSVRKLDIGGLATTLLRLINDQKFIRQVKQEFILGSFDKMIQGDM